MNEVKQERRAFLKHALAGTVAVTALAATEKKAEAGQADGGGCGKDRGKTREILYRETEAFRKHYQHLYS